VNAADATAGAGEADLKGDHNLHAKGSDAFGRFEVTKDVSKYTKASTKTDTLACLSTVAASAADMVGNNTPVFFVRDPMQALHPLPEAPRGHHLRDHDMQWDFWTLSPELG